MLVAIDYDFTYTADPDFWDGVIEAGRSRGHRFICVTGREVPPGRDERAIPVEVICSPSRFKFSTALEQGYAVDVWIDDAPGTIEPARILQWAEEQANSGAKEPSEGLLAAARPGLAGEAGCQSWICTPPGANAVNDARDAGRYRFLREENSDVEGGPFFCLEALDRSVDAAMAAACLTLRARSVE